jgi:hypothetical protein
MRARSWAVSTGALLTVLFVMGSSEAGSPETMTERCSGEVAFPPTFGSNPTTQGTVVLKRNGSGYSPWTTFTRQTGDNGHVRWYCHSTTGNVFDPGTWRVQIDGNKAKGCLVSAASAVVDGGVSAVSSCSKLVSLGSSAFNGWTPEKSRCDNRSNKFRARLGPDRLVQIQCLGD